MWREMRCADPEKSPLYQDTYCGEMLCCGVELAAQEWIFPNTWFHGSVLGDGHGS